MHGDKLYEQITQLELQMRQLLFLLSFFFASKSCRPRRKSGVSVFLEGSFKLLRQFWLAEAVKVATSLKGLLQALLKFLKYTGLTHCL